MTAQARRQIDLADLSSQIMGCIDEIEQSHDDYSQAQEDAAVAEADWKHALSTVIVRFAAQGGRSSADQREATAMVEHGDLYRTFLLAKARGEVAKSGHRSLLARLDALRTLSADARSLLGGG